MQKVDILEKVGIDIVHGCQLRCIGCPNSILKPAVKQMQVSHFREILNNIDVERINLLRLFNFGEPLLHKELPGILKIIPEQKWKVGIIEISTNAQHHDFDVLEEAIKCRIINRLNVSCDGDGTPQEYERIRTPSKWHKFIEFLHVASELQKRYDPSLVLTTRTICENPIEQRRWRQIVEPFGFMPEFRGWQFLPESSVNMLGRAPKVPARVCSFLAPQNRLYVEYDGTVVPCCVHPMAGVLGNLRRHRFSEILTGALRQNFTRQMEASRSGMKICNECEY